MAPSNSSYLSRTAIFHFHDHGRLVLPSCDCIFLLANCPFWKVWFFVFSQQAWRHSMMEHQAKGHGDSKMIDLVLTSGLIMWVDDNPKYIGTNSHLLPHLSWSHRPIGISRNFVVQAFWSRVTPKSNPVRVENSGRTRFCLAIFFG